MSATEMTLASRQKPDWYIDQIVERMCRGNWVRGASRRQLAAEWGLPVSTIANYAQIASKIVKGGTDEQLREEIKAISVEKLQIIAAKAEKAEKYGEVTKSIRVLNELTGAIQNSQAAVITVNIGGRGERLPANQVSEFAERAYAFFAEKRPDLLDEFLAFVGAAAPVIDTTAEPVALPSAE